jgi:hypothetical protein
MIHYLIHGADGKLRQRGHCANEADVPNIPGLNVEIVEEDDPRWPTVPVRDGYQDLRRMDYPTFGDQLDAIWDVLNSAGLLANNPRAKAVYDRVKAVKTRYPKE